MQQQQQKITQKNKEIFNFIAQLLCQHEFRLAQVEFFEMHCQQFEDLEENKHSHHDLYKKYTQILDDTIDSKLIERYNTDQVVIKEFYEDFQKNYQIYKQTAEFQQTVDTLFSFTDFETFKKNMLQYHQRKVNTQPGQKQKNKKEKTKLDINLDFEQFNKFYEIDKDDQCWEKILVANTDGQIDIRIQKLTENISILRTEGIIDNITPQAVVNASLDMDLEKRKQANPNIKEAFYINTKDETDDKITYYTYQLPLMGLQEHIIRSGLKKLGGTFVIHQHSVDLPEYPVKETQERVQMHRQIYVREAKNGKASLSTTISFYTNDTYDIPPMFFVMSITKQINRGMVFFTQQCQAQQALLDKEKEE